MKDEQYLQKLNDGHHWFGVWRGIPFEINQSKSSIEHFSSNWTMYLYIHLDRIPEGINPDSLWLTKQPSSIGKTKFYHYYKAPIIPDIGFPGGCTFYAKVDDDPRVIKIGCDYQHLWNEGETYTIEDIVYDAKYAIESFLRLVPGYKARCSGNGNLYFTHEGTWKNGYFTSNEYRQIEAAKHAKDEL